MNNTRKRLLIIIISSLSVLLVTALLLVTLLPTHDGVILEVQRNDEPQEHTSIWVADASPNEIMNKTKDELRKTYEYQGIVFELPSYIPDETIDELSPGQEVKIYFSGTVEASAPGGGEAYWINAKHDNE